MGRAIVAGYRDMGVLTDGNDEASLSEAAVRCVRDEEFEVQSSGGDGDNVEEKNTGSSICPARLICMRRIVVVWIAVGSNGNDGELALHDVSFPFLWQKSRRAFATRHFDQLAVHRVLDHVLKHLVIFLEEEKIKLLDTSACPPTI